MGEVMEVLRAGALTTVQDLGRPGYAHLGVPRSGALDAAALGLANRLVGNPAGAAGLETTLDGCALRFGRAVTAAVGGAACAVRVAGRAAAWGVPVRVPAGAVLEVGAATAGVRAYVAVGGGLEPEAVLGSRSTDLLSGLGPAVPADGASVRLGPVRGALPRPPDFVPWAGPARELVLPARLGPRDDWFTAEAVGAFARSVYRVSPDSNRVGLRLEGPSPERARTGELPSEGMVLGAVQIPPEGGPVVFLNDHPTTGGYPVIAVVDPGALGAAAQARPGTRVRFVLRRG